MLSKSFWVFYLQTSEKEREREGEKEKISTTPETNNVKDTHTLTHKRMRTYSEGFNLD